VHDQAVEHLLDVLHHRVTGSRCEPYHAAVRVRRADGDTQLPRSVKRIQSPWSHMPGTVEVRVAVALVAWVVPEDDGLEGIAVVMTISPSSPTTALPFA